MAKTKKETTVKVKIIGPNKNVGVMVNGEICKPDDVVSVGPMTAKGLIARERAVAYTEDDKASAKSSGKASK